MRRRKRRGLEPPDDNWLVSYADMMTLLLYLFIILYALAVRHKGDVEDTLKSFSNSLFNKNIIDIFDKPAHGTTQLTDETTYDLVQKYITENNLQNLVDISKDQNGIALKLKVELLFDTGDAIIKPGSTKILDEISLLLKKIPNNIIVKGYTDNQPIDSSQYPSNWELSSDRAVKIVRYFIDVNRLDAKRFKAEGDGENNPVASNKTAEGRQKNRRVEIFIEYKDAQ